MSVSQYSDYKEKPKFYLPKKIYYSLRDDAKIFEFYRKNGKDINFNRFIATVIDNYYDEFNGRSHEELVEIESILEKYQVQVPEYQKLADELLKFKFYSDNKAIFREKRDAQINFTVTKDLISKFYISEYDGGRMNDLLISYTLKPAFERERIVFKKMYEDLCNKCEHNTPIKLAIKRYNGETLTHVTYNAVPYEMVTPKDGPHNYLLAQVREDNNETKAMSFRLDRIESCELLYKDLRLTEDSIKCFERMKVHGPQFAINTPVEYTVALSAEGMNTYNSIYINRPKYDSIEKMDDGRNMLTFTCSETQLLQHFERYQSGCEILSPESTRQKLLEFHEKALENYKD